jgi:carboxymethylenebutenolidase
MKEHDMSDTIISDSVSWVRTTTLDRRQAMKSTVAAAGFALAVQPVSAATITTPTDGLDAGMISFPVGDRDMAAYRAKPTGKNNLGVIIVVQEIFGVHEWIKDIVRRFAAAGYYAVAPDLYARQGDATQVADIQTLVSTIVSKVPDAQVMSDLDALTKFVGSDGGDGNKIGITGFCWGGRITWLYAAHNPIDIVANLKVPVYGLYGDLDKGIPTSDVQKMTAALKAAKKKSLIASYADADHGFLADYRPSYNEAVAKHAWDRALRWFAKYMK